MRPDHLEAKLDRSAVDEYKRTIALGTRPTVLALSVLDVKAPFSVPRDATIVRHWGLAHYVIDGHHKLAAAAELGGSYPIQLLSFLSKGASMADWPTDLDLLRAYLRIRHPD